jgi:hypothetical protein
MNTEAALTDPQRWNRYVYTGNNPLRRIDPDGRDWWDFARGTGRGVVDTVTAPVPAGHRYQSAGLGSGTVAIGLS